MSITGWICLAIYATIALATYIPNRNATGDRAVGMLIPMLLMPAVLLFAALLGFAQYRGWVPAVSILALLLALPILFPGPVIGTNIVSSFLNSRSQQLRGQFRDPGLSEIAAAIQAGDQQPLKSRLVAQAKIDWTARDRSGFTLFGIAVKEAKLLGGDDRPSCLRAIVEAGVPFQGRCLRAAWPDVA